MDKSNAWIEERAAEALTFLADTDEEDANLRSEMVKAERRLKLTEDAVFKMSTGSIEARKAEARTSIETQAVFVEYAKSMQDFHSLHNKRTTCRDKLEWARTLSVNRRQGMIL